MARESLEARRARCQTRKHGSRRAAGAKGNAAWGWGRAARAWQQTMVSASHCVGLTLPGMMLLPGSFSGSDSSPSPHRGPLPSRRMSLATCAPPHPAQHPAPARICWLPVHPCKARPVGYLCPALPYPAQHPHAAGPVQGVRQGSCGLLCGWLAPLALPGGAQARALNSETATVLSAPLASTIASCAASASNLLGAVTKGSPMSSATAAANFSAKPFFVFRPVPTAVPPCARMRGQCARTGHRAQSAPGQAADSLLLRMQGLGSWQTRPESKQCKVKGGGTHTTVLDF